MNNRIYRLIPVSYGILLAPGLVKLVLLLLGVYRTEYDDLFRYAAYMPPLVMIVLLVRFRKDICETSYPNIMFIGCLSGIGLFLLNVAVSFSIFQLVKQHFPDLHPYYFSSIASNYIRPSLCFVMIGIFMLLRFMTNISIYQKLFVSIAIIFAFTFIPVWSIPLGLGMYAGLPPTGPTIPPPP